MKRMKLKRLKIICVMILTVMALLLPGTVFAQNAQDPDPGSEWNIKIEFRYTKGEEGKLKIPNTISMYGRTYQLVSKSDPVPETKLPATRTYTWLVEGSVTEEGRSALAGVDGLEFTPANVEIGRVVDKHETTEGLPTNDVEMIAMTKSYPDGEFVRAAVRFDEEGLDDYDLPLSYTAEVVYRGLEKYIGPGYEVRATYTTKEDLDGVPLYVIVATYEPVGLVPIAVTGGGGTGAGSEPAQEAVLSDPDTVESEPLIDQEEANIGESPVPQTVGEGNPAPSINPFLLALIIVAAALCAFVAWAFLTRRKYKRQKARLREERLNV